MQEENLSKRECARCGKKLKSMEIYPVILGKRQGEELWYCREQCLIVDYKNTEYRVLDGARSWQFSG